MAQSFECISLDMCMNKQIFDLLFLLLLLPHSKYCIILLLPTTIIITTKKYTYAHCTLQHTIDNGDNDVDGVEKVLPSNLLVLP